MEKRIISVILTLAVIATMFSGLSMVAFAGDSFENATVLENGVASEVIGNFADETEVFKFIPEESGYYSIYTSYEGEDEYFYAYLFNKKQKMLSVESVNDFYGNYYIQYYLEAGETYYIKTACYGRCDYKVTCKKLPAITSMEIDSYPAIMDYYEGCVYSDLTGLKIKLTLEDGTVDYLEYDYENYMAAGYILDITENYDENTKEFSKVKIACADKSLEFDFNIMETPVESITVDQAPTRVYYWGDQNFGFEWKGEYTFSPDDLRGLVITVNYKDGTKKTYDNEELADGEINGYWFDFGLVNENSVIGENPVEFIYMNVSTTYNVTLAESPVESLEVIKAPTDINIYIPQLATYYGMQIKVNMKDGTSNTIEVNKDNSFAFGYDNIYVEDDSLISPVLIYDSGNLTFVTYIDKDVSYEEMNYCDDKYFNDIEVENVSLNPKNMVIYTITGYDDNAKKEKLNILEIDETAIYDDCYDGYILTDLGYAHLFISKKYDIDGNFNGYLVELEYSAVEVDIEMQNGDVDFNGTINATDALAVLKHAAKLEELDSSAMIVADVVADNSINASDALEILKYAAKLRPEL